MTAFPPVTYPTIIAGTSWHWEFPPFLDTSDDRIGEPFDWTEEPARWLLEASLTNTAGRVLAYLSNSGSPDGDITADDVGVVAFDLDSSKTADLPITRTYTNSVDPRIAAFRSRAPLFFTLTVTDLDNPTDVWPLLTGVVTVQQP